MASITLAEPAHHRPLPGAAGRTPDARWVFSRPAAFIAFGAGSGLVRRGPGTAGTLAAFPLHWLLVYLLSPGVHLAAIGLLFGVGVWACAAASRDLGSDDHGGIVIDEVVAFLLVLWAVPATWWAWVSGFLLFRLFDIAKPPPIGWCDRTLKGGFGVMFDDLLAALATLLVFAIPVIVAT